MRKTVLPAMMVVGTLLTSANVLGGWRYLFCMKSASWDQQTTNHKPHMQQKKLKPKTCTNPIPDRTLDAPAEVKPSPIATKRRKLPPTPIRDSSSPAAAAPTLVQCPELPMEKRPESPSAVEVVQPAVVEHAPEVQDQIEDLERRLSLIPILRDSLQANIEQLSPEEQKKRLQKLDADESRLKTEIAAIQ
jgi:hypothetical protein